MLVATSFMAFGNSITEGKNASGQVQNTYPVNLRVMLAARYTTQSISVINKGVGGERASQGADRLPRELDLVHPEVLLLEEGVNDLSDEPHDISALIAALRVMVRQARNRSIAVFLGTLLPARAGGTPPRGDGALPFIPEANAQIRLLAQSERVTLVDLYEGFGGSPDLYIDVDGLHPNELGYQKIAQLYFDAIKTTLEIRQTPGVATEFVQNTPTPNLPFMRLR